MESADATIDPKLNGKVFGIVAAQCEGMALTIAEGTTEGDGRALLRHFDTLWRSDKPASLIDCAKTITNSTLSRVADFESFVAQRATAARRLHGG